ncbi:HAMP domain-containing sensor histidine kinase [Nitrospirillum sp. BR 11163]|uniref:sensor histidine kinase n=1 Tax=Nitrospirillum sp. BR 11163 TaxID=3104323 RepID=UPI002AFE7075|nr:HAMP domain-containing sensor histidine kinase [Nitrospirillum sp. BR 11163]MEA1672428.1 HAMP domain-containing sensor histidine kinase [Nitrospirillum sp. BR 11163]
MLRIMVPVCAAGLLMIGLFGTGERTLNRLTGAIDQIVTHNLAGSIKLSDINTRVQNVNARFNRLLAVKSAGRQPMDVTAELAAITAQVDAIVIDLQAYRDVQATPDQRARLDEILRNLADYKSSVAWVGSMLGIDFASTVSFIEPFGAVFDRVQAELTRIVAETGQDAQSRAAEATRQAEVTVRAFLYSAVAVMVGIALLAWLIGRYQQRLRINSEILRQEVEARTAELRQANGDLAASAETLRQLGDAGLALTATLDLGEVHAALWRHLSELIPVDVFGMVRISADGRDLLFERFVFEGQPWPAFSRPILQGTEPAVRALRQGGGLVLTADEAASWARGVAGDRLQASMQAAIWWPLVVSGRVLAVVTVQNHDPRAYGSQALEILRSACAYAAIAIANACSYRDLEATLAELRTTQDKLVQQEKMASLGRLVAGVAHEINTPLGVVLTAAGSLHGGVTDLRDAIAQGRLTRSALEQGIAEWADLATVVERNALRTATLVKSFSAVAVDETEGRILETDLSILLHDVIALFRPALDRGAISLDLAVADGLVIRTVPESLTDALTRILANTIDHAFPEGQGGHVTVTATMDDEGANATIIVVDNGCGIAPEVLSHVCDPFFTTARGSGHPGLGLHVAYNQATQRLKGMLTVESTVGVGSRVTLRLAQQALFK